MQTHCGRMQALKGLRFLWLQQYAEVCSTIQYSFDCRVECSSMHVLENTPAYYCILLIIPQPKELAAPLAALLSVVCSNMQ